MADVSVIIPTFNRLWCLPDAVNSCRNTKCLTEIIVVDDGSNDGTWEWLQQQSDLISVQQENLGKCWAVNHAVAISNGKYIRFLDSDDMLDAGAIDEQFYICEKEQSDINISGYKLFDNNGIISVHVPNVSDDIIAQQLGESDGSHYSAYLFKSDFISTIPHRPDFAFRDDRLLVLEAVLKDPSISYHNGTALLHRINHNDRLQISRGTKMTVQNYQHLLLYKFILGKLSNNNKLTPRRIDAAVGVLWHLANWTAISHIKEAEGIFCWIKNLKPDFVIPDRGFKGRLFRLLGFSGTQKLLRVFRFFKYGWQ